MACKYIYKGITYNSKEEFISQAVKPQFLSNQKVRRVLEVQSDLFQKGRDKEDLIKKQGDILGDSDYLFKHTDGKYYKIPNWNDLGLDSIQEAFDYNYAIEITKEEYENKDGSKENPSKNKFLQLLNKDNNWVTFFIKSIIQDSAKKGYEKVLFPKGDTAAKIEGHQTLEEFKKQKEARIKELENKLADKTTLEAEVMQDVMEAQRDEFIELNPDTALQDVIDGTKREIKQLKQELANVESGKTQLSSIANFYEDTISNILKKNGYNPVEITDEYGNKWNEVIITPSMKDAIFLQKPSTKQYLPPDPKIEARVKDLMAELGIRLESFDEYSEWYEETYGRPLNAVGVADMFKKVIAVKEGKADKYTIAEELSHFIAYALKDDKKVIEALSLIESTEEWKNHSEAYIEDYEGDMDAVRLEIFGKLMAKQLADNIADERPIWKQRLDRIWKQFLQFFTFGNKAKELRIKNTVDSIVNDVLQGNTKEIKEGLSKQGEGIFKQLDPNDFKNSKILNSMSDRLEGAMDVLYNKIQEAKQKGVQSFTEREKAIYDKLLIDYKKGRTTKGIINFISHVEGQVDNLLGKIGQLQDEFTEGSYDTELDSFIKLLRDMDNYISIYEPLVKSLIADTSVHRVKVRNEGGDTREIDMIMNALQSIQTGITTMQERASTYQGELLVDKLKPILREQYPDDAQYETEVERLRGLITVSYEDVGLARRWADSAAESKDMIIGLTDRQFKEELYSAGVQTDDDSKDMLNAHIALTEAGIENTHFMYELDENGIPTGNYVSDVNEAKFEKAIGDFFVGLRKEFKLTQDPEIENINQRIEDLEKQVEDITNGKRKPFVKAGTSVKVTNANEYFGKEVKFDTKTGDKETTLAYLNNRIKYLQEKGEKSYSKAAAHRQRVLERSEMHRLDVARYNKAIAKWFKENTEENPEWRKLLEEKEKEIYNGVFYFKKDIATVNRIKEQYGNKWKDELVAQHPELAAKTKRAEEILNSWKSERMVTTTKRGETIISFRREFARPKLEKYGNPAYQRIMNDPAMKAYYDAYLDMRAEKVAHMSSEYRNSKLMPQIRKDVIERIKTDPGRTIPETLRDAFKVREDETERGTLKLDAEGRKIQQVPIHYFNKLDNMSDLSMDATASMIMFSNMANKHKALSRIVDTAEMTADILRTRTIKKEGNYFRDETVDEGGNAYKMYKDLMEMRIYGEYKLDEGDFMGLDNAKMADAFNKYTSLNALALNVYAGFQNVLLGNLIIRQEAFANEYVDKKDVLYADKKYWGDIKGVIEDVGKVRSESYLRLFMEKFDVLQDRDGRTAEVNTDRSRWGRMFSFSHLFFINHMGEHQMQGRMAIALAHKKKVLDASGNEIPLYEAFEVKNYKLEIKEGIKKLNGEAFTNRDIAAFTIKMNAINQRLHGVYNAADKSAMQRHALGRLIILFRKWMKPGFNRRFESEYRNYSLEADVEGFYRTAFNFMYELGQELKKGQFTIASAKEHYTSLSDHKKANLRRALMEAGLMLGAIATASLAEMLVEGLDDDDEVKVWAANMAAYQANRLFTELGFYVPVLGINEAIKIVKTPAAAVNQIDRILDIGKVVEPFAFLDDDPIFPDYQRGRHKGESKLGVWATDLIPLYSTVEDWFYPEDRLKFFTQ